MQLLLWTPSASTEVTWAAATQPEQPLFADHWMRNRCDGKYTAIIKDHHNHYCSKYGLAMLHILCMLFSFSWWPGWSLGSWLLYVTTAVTQHSDWSQTCTFPFFSTLRAMLANWFWLSRVSNQRPEITLHWHLQKILLIKFSRERCEWKQKFERQSFTCTGFSCTLKASANSFPPHVHPSLADTSPGKEPQPAPWLFPLSLVFPIG